MNFSKNFQKLLLHTAKVLHSFNNRSEKGALTQSVLMSVFFTIKQRGLNPVDTVKQALKIHLETGILPQLKEFTTPRG